MPPAPKPARKRSERAATEQEARWMARVVRGGCVLCRHLGRGYQAAGVHHPREGQGVGQRASNYLAIALCRECHQGDAGFHGLGKHGFYMRYRLDELDLLAMTIEGVATGDRFS